MQYWQLQALADEVKFVPTAPMSEMFLPDDAAETTLPCTSAARTLEFFISDMQFGKSAKHFWPNGTQAASVPSSQGVLHFEFASDQSLPQ
jgi:hypothetical protein